MKIFIVGGAGRVATSLICKLVKRGHSVVAGARDINKVEKQDGVEAVAIDLHATVDELAKVIKGSDAVYFTAGSRGKDLLQTDAFGAVKLAMAAKQCGIKRFVLLSSLYALEPQMWAQVESLKNLTDYNIAKFFADNYLLSTDLDYTIIQPTVLKEEPETGLVNLRGDYSTENTIGDVAEVLASVLERPNTFRKVIKMSSGSQKIDDALSEI